MTTQRADTFTRANVASGWGTATDTHVWTMQAGDAQSVSSNEGVIIGSSASTFATLGASLSTADGEGLVRFMVDDATNTAGLLLRFKDINNYYLARYDGAGHIAFFKDVAGTKTTVGSYAFTPTVGSFYWLRFHVSGTTIEIRTWADGGSEPGTWNYSTTDSSLSGTSSGNLVGLYGFSNGAANNYDSFAVNDLAGTTIPLSGTLPSGATLSAVLNRTTALASALPSAAALAGTLTAGSHGLGIANLTVSTRSESWTGGPGGSPGTATTVTSADSSDSGWEVDLLPTYGALPLSSLFQRNSGTLSANQTSLATSVPDGMVHWLEQLPSAVFGGSEDAPFTLTELGPTGTAFRRYYQGTFGPDTNGFNWLATVCIYPGDPGLIAYRFDCINPSGSAITLASSDSLEIALIGGLQQSDATWDPTNGGYGQVGSSPVAGWPSSLSALDLDYAYIAPAAGSGITLGRMSALKQRVSTLSPAWASPQVTYLQDSIRLKFKVQGNQTTFPASHTSTVYLLHVLRRGLTSTDAAAITADYQAPGTPTTTTGTFSSFSYDEAAYVFAASGNALSATLDFTPTHVTTRFKPRYKITGWTAGAPSLAWGGSALTAGVDYRYTVDSTNHILYLHLATDVVASGAVTGQRNNAALVVTATIPLVGSLSAAPSYTATLATTRPLAASLAASPALIATLTVTHLLPSAVVGTGSGLAASSLVVTRKLSAALPSQADLSAVRLVVATLIPLAATLPSGAGLSATLQVAPHLAATIPSAAGLTASTLVVGHLIAASVAPNSGLSAALQVQVALKASLPSAAGYTGTLSRTTALSATLPTASGLSALLATTRPLSGVLPSASGLTATTLALVPHLAGTLPAASGLSGTLRSDPAFSGSLLASPGLSAVLVASRPLSVVLPSASSLSVGALGISRPLSATLAPAASLSGFLTVPLAVIRLSASLSAAPALTGTLTVTDRLSPAALVAGPALSASLLSPRALSASLPAAPSLSGTLLTSISLPRVTLPTSSGLSSSTLVVVRSLAAQCPSGASLAAPGLTITRHLASTLPTQAALSGVPSVPAVVIHLVASLPAPTPALSGLLGVTRPLACAVSAAPAFSGSLHPTTALAGSLSAPAATFSGSLRRTVALAVGLPSGAGLAAACRITRPLTSLLSPAPALSGVVTFAPTGILYTLALALSDAPLATLSLTSATGG